MTRLPIPGQDDGVWGTILNDYLSVEHNADGSLKRAADIDTAKSTAQTAQATANAAYTKPSTGIPKSDLTTSMQSSLDKADSALQSAPVSSVVGQIGTITGAQIASDPAFAGIVRRRSGTASTQALLLFANAQDYGATGDGTTDDTAAVQSFLNAWSSMGGDFVMPPGTYVVTTNLTCTPAVAGRLYAYGAIIKVGTGFPTGANPALSIRGSNVAIHGLVVDGNSLADRVVTLRDHSKNVRFYDCEFRNAGQQAAETDVNVVGLRLEGDIANVDIERCFIHGITAGGGVSSSFARAILISDPNSAGVTTNVKVRGCTFTDINFVNPSTDADAICIQNWSVNTWLLIDGCYFKNLHKRAVKIQSPGVTVSNCTLENNYVGTNGVNGSPDPQVYAGISVYANDCVIANNNLIGGSWFHGIEIGAATQTTQRVTITGNRVIGANGAVMAGSGGIRVYGDATCSEFMIVGNYVGRFTNGIWLSTAATGIVVSGNQVNGYGAASTSGVLIDGQSGTQPTRLAISGNSFEQITRYGIETAIVPTDMTATGNMAGRSGFEVISASAFQNVSRRTFAAANGGGGSVATGADGLQGTFLPQGGVLVRAVRGVTAIAYAASMTPDAKLGDWQTVTVTNSSAITINAPTNPPASTQSQVLTIEIFNNSGGVMGTITWNAAFVFPGITWANPAAAKRRYAMFQWNGASWICTLVANADY